MAELRLHEAWERGHEIEELVGSIVDEFGLAYRPYRAELSSADHDRAARHAREQNVRWTYQRQSKSDSGPLRLYVQTQRSASKYAGTLLLHRWVTDAGKGRKVDHIDGNTLNNYPRNLRVGTTRANNQNLRRTKSQYRGVRPVGPKWAAEIKVRGRWVPLGLFAYEGAAANAHDEASWAVHGDKKKLNFP